MITDLLYRLLQSISKWGHREYLTQLLSKLLFSIGFSNFLVSIGLSKVLLSIGFSKVLFSIGFPKVLFSMGFFKVFRFSKIAT